MDEDDFYSSLTPDQRRWYDAHHRSGTSSRQSPIPSASFAASPVPSEESISSRHRQMASQVPSEGRRTSGGLFGCCSGSGERTDTPPRSRRPSSRSTPATTPQLATPQYTPLPGDTPTLGTPQYTPLPGQTPTLGTPQDTPVLGTTPIATPAPTPPRFYRETEPGASYTIDVTGALILDDNGKRVVSRMRGLCSQMFRHHMLKQWDEIPRDLKDRIIHLLHEEFPVPRRELRFNEDLMRVRMREYCKHKRSEVSRAIKDGRSRPTWLAKEDWKAAKKYARENPEKWKQQRAAAHARIEAGSSHHLGSGGWSSFEADFWAITGRDPSPFEREYGGRRGLNAVVDALHARGGENPTEAPLQREEVSD